MSWSVNIGSIAGTAIRIHVTFLLFLAFVFGGGLLAGNLATAVVSLGFILLLFACVLAHEFGHILTARAFAVETPDVTLLPIGGVARLSRMPENPGQEFLIAVAGPLVNLAIAGALMAAHFAAMPGPPAALLARLAQVNLLLAVFNMVPAFPMDGGRVLRAALATRLGHVRATRIAAAIGQLAAVALGVAGLLYSNPMLIFIALFVYLAAASEAQMVVLRAMARDVPVTVAMVTRFAALAPGTPLAGAAQALMQVSETGFPVVDDEARLIGFVDRAAISKAARTRPQAQVGDVMTRDVATVDCGGALDEAFQLLQERQLPAVGVVDRAGRLMGLVTSSAIDDMARVQRSMPQGARLRPWRPPA